MTVKNPQTTMKSFYCLILSLVTMPSSSPPLAEESESSLLLASSRATTPQTTTTLPIPQNTTKRSTATISPKTANNKNRTHQKQKSPNTKHSKTSTDTDEKSCPVPKKIICWKKLSFPKTFKNINRRKNHLLKKAVLSQSMTCHSRRS